MNIRMYRTMAAVVLALLIALVTPLSTMAQTHTNEVRMQTMSDALTDATLQEECVPKGRSGEEWHWWGTRTYLNSCDSDFIISMYNVGASAEVVCPWIERTLGVPLGVACTLATALYNIGGFALEELHKRGGGNGLYVDQYHGAPLPHKVWYQ